MTILTETSHANEALVAELPGHLSRDTGVLISGQNLKAQTVLGKITASGKYTILAPAASDGSQTACAILYDAVDASAGDKPCVVHYKDAAFNAGEVIFPNGISSPNKATAIANLKLVGIVLR